MLQALAWAAGRKGKVGIVEPVVPPPSFLPSTIGTWQAGIDPSRLHPALSLPCSCSSSFYLQEIENIEKEIGEEMDRLSVSWAVREHRSQQCCLPGEVGLQLAWGRNGGQVCLRVVVVTVLSLFCQPSPV